MPDDEKPADALEAPAEPSDESKPPIDDVLDDAGALEAPAVQGGALWGGARFMHDFGPDPVWVETKEQYWDLCRRHGVRMKDMQESTTGQGERGTADVPHELRPVEVPPMSQDEAHVIGAFSAITRRYGLREALTCQNCFIRNRKDGVRIVVTNRRVILQCRCGVAHYQAPKGTTDLVLGTLANVAITLNDSIFGTVDTPVGREVRPTKILHDMEALLIHRYINILNARGLTPHWFHTGCWTGNALNHLEEMALSIRTKEIVMVCKCLTLFWRGSRHVEPVAPPVVH